MFVDSKQSKHCYLCYCYFIAFLNSTHLHVNSRTCEEISDDSVIFAVRQHCTIFSYIEPDY